MRRFLSVMSIAVLIGSATAATVGASESVNLFGTAEFRAASHDALPQWQRVLAGIERETSVYDACAEDSDACPNRAMMAWQALLKGLDGARQREQVNEVNRFFNQWRYKVDQDNFGRSDYWATPMEFFRHAGDCEDYAIAKYVSLRRLGFPADQLRIAVVQDTLRDIAHAVLVVYLEDEAVVLDNLTNAVLPHHRISQYAPYYTINEEARWAHVPPQEIVLSADMVGDGSGGTARR